MKPRLIRMLFILLAVLLLLSACQQPADTTQEPTIIPTSAVPETQPPAAVEKSASAAVLQACNLQEQKQALRVGQDLDLETLPIDTCYDLAFELLADGSAYRGTAVITYTNQEADALDNLVLRVYPNAQALFGGRLTIDSADLNGENLNPNPTLSDGSALQIALDTPINPAETVVLTLAFSAEIPDFSTSGYHYGIFTYFNQYPLVVLANSYPALAPRVKGDWQVDPLLPMGDPPLFETALYRVLIRVPSGWKVSATGVEIDHSRTDEQEIFQFAGGPVREFHWAASPAWDMQTLETDGILLRQWGFSDTAAVWEEALAILRDSMTTFEQHFGPYPFAELDILAVPLHLAAGVEYPGEILIRDWLYITEEEPRMLPTVLVHEAAHQWWFSVVGSDVLDEPWQDEALTTYSSLLYLWDYDRPFYNGTVAAYEERVKAIEDEAGWQAVGQPVSAFVGETSSAYSAIVYRKGALFFDALRRELGDEAFFNALQAYYLTNRFQLADTQALLGAFEQACLCQLDDFYADWGVP